MTIRKMLLALPMFALTACSSQPIKTVEKIDIERFMGDWYVLGGRFTMFEKEVHNGIESYTLDANKKDIQVSFNYNKGSFTGEKKSLPQKAYVYNMESKAHWKVSPLRPFWFNYLIVAVADDYSWTAIGVPDQAYLWIMARDYKNPELTMESAIKKLNSVGYRADIEVTVPHQY